MSPAQETRQYAAEQLRGVDRAARTVEIVASDFSIDSYGTRIDPAGWDLAQFKKNPVICLQHDSYGRTESNGLPIARAIPETVRVEGGKLLMSIQFPDAGKFPLADQVFELVADGFLRGISVGFDPSEREVVEESDTNGYKQQVTIFRKSKLFEVSLVTIPSNDNALILSRSKQMNADEKTIREKTETLEAELRKSAVTVERALWEKYEGYYLRKQPANRAATKVLAAYFKRVLKEEAPDDEIAAWERMGESVETTPEEVKPPEAPKEEPKPAPEPEPKKEEPTPAPSIPAPAAEAPQHERKTSVQLSARQARQLPQEFARALTEAAAAALRKGVPVKDLDGVLEAVGKQLKASLVSA